ncbi:hypothetical protein MUK42_04136 [Musa troglodytarum]|uniref:Uncharacterized protein n=1 Tax=Musa troglodytarum TaxID=320322 RepID=A0A9E7GDQ2_9LILI|nr:hypothetical protein MUK42_04136 [Musa troglodytarum]
MTQNDLNPVTSGQQAVGTTPPPNFRSPSKRLACHGWLPVVADNRVWATPTVSNSHVGEHTKREPRGWR